MKNWGSNIFRACFAAALLAFAPAARAAFEDLGAGARAAGLGGAFVAVADDVYAAYYNPAGLALLTRPEATASYSRLYLGLTDGSNIGTSYVGYAYPLAEGAKGTLGAAWNALSVDTNLYREDSFILSYARKVLERDGTKTLFVGGNLKYLRSSFGSFPEASDSTNGVLVLSGQSDPVLSGSRSQTAIDTDLGFLYRVDPHYALGLSLTHINQPNVAFDSGDSDRLPLGVKFGANYRSLLSNLVAQIDTQRAPSGKRDIVFTTGAERWLLSTANGSFGMRGAFSAGSRELKRLSMGFSYKTRRLRFDYGFQMPIGTIAKTAGTHRFALVFRFGRKTDDEESIVLLLEAMRQLKETSPVRRAVKVGHLNYEQKAAYTEYMAQSRSLRGQARYKESREMLSRALTIAPASKDLLTLYSRLNSVDQIFPVLPGYKEDPIEAALHRGITAYLQDRSLESIERVSYALINRPEDKAIERLLTHLELATGIARVKSLARRHESLILETKLTRAEAAMSAKRYREAIELSLSVLREDDENTSAWQHMGTAYFALRDYDSSLRAWGNVLKYEKSPAVREAIRGYMKTISRIQRKRDAQLRAKESAKKRAEKRAKERARERARRKLAVPKRPKLTDKEVEKYFDDGVKHYTRRDYPKAAEAFKKILQSYPNHPEARKALNRIQERLR